MASKYYRYTPLSSDSSFRLLRLKKPLNSRCFSETVEVELFEVTSVNAPAFEAVSYAWDHAGTYTTLVCDGQELHVSPVVSEMIITLSRISTNGVFWIDAICIDQSSTIDKNTQVPRMRVIFSEAQSVWIWLGRGSYESRMALDFLVDLDALTGSGGAAGATNSWRNSVRSYQDMIQEARGVYDAVDTDFIIDVIRLPWFHRSWTIQEVALAKTATIVCGDITLKWSSFLSTLKRLQDTLNDYAIYGADSRRRLISNPATFFDDIRTHSMMTDVVLGRRSLPLSNALDLIRQQRSTDPKDKVYGLYGIFDYLDVHGQDLPQVDYTCSVQQIYCEMTRAILLNDQTLYILYMIGPQSYIPDLPTWVPDYSNTDFIRYIDVYRNKASKRSSASFTFDISGSSLSISGIVLDEIYLQATSTSVCTTDFRQGFAARFDLSSIEERHMAVTELIRTLRSWIDTSRNINSYPTGEEPDAAFFKIMTQTLRPGSQHWPTHARSVVSQDLFEEWVSIVTTDLSQDPKRLCSDISELENDLNSIAIINDYIRLFGCSQNPRDWSAELQIRLLLRARDQALSTLQHDISLLSYQRTFFTTKNGYMGVGPRLARSTDRIALIAGLQLPFIMRQNGDNYSLIGPAYIHGLMRGEQWRSQLAETITLV